MCVASCGRKLDTQGVVPSHNKLCFTSAHPRLPEQEVTLMLSCKCSALQPSEGHYRKGPWHPALYPSPSVHLMSHTWPDYLVSPTWILLTIESWTQWRRDYWLNTCMYCTELSLWYWCQPSAVGNQDSITSVRVHIFYWCCPPAIKSIVTLCYMYACAANCSHHILNSSCRNLELSKLRCDQLCHLKSNTYIRQGFI